MEPAIKPSIQRKYREKPLRLKSLLTKSRNGKKFLNMGIQKITTKLLSLELDQPLLMKEVAEIIHRSFRKQFPDKLFSDKTIQKRLYDAVLVLREVNIVYLQRKRLRIIPQKVEGLSDLVEMMNELAKKKRSLEQKKQEYKKLRCVKELFNTLEERNKKNPELSKNKVDIANLVGVIVKKQNIGSTEMQQEIQSIPIKVEQQISDELSEEKENMAENEIYNQSEEEEEENEEENENKHENEHEPHKTFNLGWIRKPQFNFVMNNEYVFNNCQKIISNIQLIYLLLFGKKQM